MGRQSIAPTVQTKGPQTKAGKLNPRPIQATLAPKLKQKGHAADKAAIASEFKRKKSDAVGKPYVKPRDTSAG